MQLAAIFLARDASHFASATHLTKGVSQSLRSIEVIK